MENFSLNNLESVISIERRHSLDDSLMNKAALNPFPKREVQRIHGVYLRFLSIKANIISFFGFLTLEEK